MTPLIITNSTIQGGWDVTCTLIGSASMSRAGGTSASASSGSGGWQVIDRSRKKATTEWLDFYPWVQTCTCLLDIDIVGGQDVEGWITTLESFEEPVAGSQPPLPPILTISGPVAHTDLFWVCSRLDFAGGETGQIRNASGARTQQGFTIELTEYSPSTAISSQTLSPAQAAATNVSSLGLGSAGQSSVAPSGKTYTCKGGETLQEIAAFILGNLALWPEIAILNGFSASVILQPGQVVYLPTP